MGKECVRMGLKHASKIHMKTIQRDRTAIPAFGFPQKVVYGSFILPKLNELQWYVACESKWMLNE